MDLTQTHPRSPYAELDGLPWLPRMIDKARAAAAGSLGDYSYPCGMDEAALSFYGFEAQAFLEVVKTSASDEAVLRHVRAQMVSRSMAEIEAFRRKLLFLPPQDDERCSLLDAIRAEMGPKGVEVTTFAEAIALDEGWAVPKEPSGGTEASSPEANEPGLA